MVDLRKVDHAKTYGNSMYPLFRDGDILFYKPLSFKAIRVNDILLIRRQNLYYAHRVIYKNKSYVITKGDNNDKADPDAFPKNIVGKVHYVKRNNQKIEPENFYLIQSSYYLKEIRKIVRAFEKRKIPLVMLKGLPLYLFYYDSYPRRIYTDCDILIYEKDSNMVDASMKIASYQKVTKNQTNKLFIYADSETVYYKRHNIFSTVFDVHTLPIYQLSVESHPNLFYSGYMLNDMVKELITSYRIININDTCVSILSPCHLLTYLALHFFQHNYRGAFRLNFIHTVIQKECSDKMLWEKTKAFILKYHLENFVYPVFLMVRKYYNTSIPDSFINSIKPKSLIAQFYTRSVLIAPLFDEQAKVEAGIWRFISVFTLSSESFYKKARIFFNPLVLKIIVQTVEIKIKQLWDKINKQGLLHHDNV